MAIYMLHFACTNSIKTSEIEANACVIANNLDDAEMGGRELIQSLHYDVKELIAYSHIEESDVANLNQVDAMLYLKASQNKEQRAIIFS